MKPYYETKLGKLYHGDCLEIMPQLGQMDLVVADPPYNFTTASAGAGKLNPWADLCNAAYWFGAWQKMAMKRTETRQGALWNFCNWRTVPTITKSIFDIGFQIESMLIWNKCWIGPGGPRGLRPSYEQVALICHNKFRIKNRSLYDIQEFPWSSHKPNNFNAEKPIDLIIWLITESSSMGAKILDPFSGAGTTGAACEKLGRYWVAIEISEVNCELSAKRIENERKQLKLFR